MVEEIETIKTELARPYTIVNPVVAFLNLAGAECAEICSEDAYKIGGIFDGEIICSHSDVPKCNILFLYINLPLQQDALTCARTIRQIAVAAGAHIVVIANEVDHVALQSQNLIGHLAKDREKWPMNLVITLFRNNEHFATFFLRLFRSMLAGITMPMAWVELAPQGPQTQTDIPGTLCLQEAGHINFRRESPNELRAVR
jgi:hypothetical protein